MDRPSSAGGDPHGEEQLNADLVDPAAGSPGNASLSMFHHLVARTRFFDELTLEQLAAGTPQVVIVGAGYDGRALRFRTPGVRFFEVDLPETQHDKRERLSRLGVAANDITYIPLDLATGDVDAALAAAGHDAAASSLFTCEGLLLYLDVAVIERLFRALRRRVTHDATLALSVGLRDRVVVDPAAAARRAIRHYRLRRLGEPARTTLMRAEWRALLRKCGWEPDREVDPHAVTPDAPAGGASLMTAIPAARPES
jgi:methyltransferase (TIGR00027 family)